MVREMAPARRRRIFARLREDLSCEDIAREEGVTSERIRQIVSEVLQKRAVDSGTDHAKLQLDRLAPQDAPNDGQEAKPSRARIHLLMLPENRAPIIRNRLLSMIPVAVKICDRHFLL